MADRPLTATFDQPHASSDGGAILLQAADRRLGLLAALTAAVPDARASARVTHSVGELVAQRVFAIACGHPDGNDADRLADDPIHKLLLGRDPIGDAAATCASLRSILMSPRTKRTARSNSPSFNGFYDHWCYLPLVASLTFDDEARQYLVAAILRPGNAAGTGGAVSLLRRLLPKLWRAFPGARLRVRLDAGYATSEIFDLLETAGVEYVVAMGTNPVLDRHAEPFLAPLRAVVASTHDTATTYGEAAYQTRDHGFWPSTSWGCSRTGPAMGGTHSASTLH